MQLSVGSVIYYTIVIVAVLSGNIQGCGLDITVHYVFINAATLHQYLSCLYNRGYLSNSIGI